MGFFGIDEFPSGQEKQQYNQLSGASSFGVNQGEGDITAGTDFMKGILSGDASKITQTLAPQISALKTSTQQSNKTLAQNGTRGGGTGAAMADSNDKVLGDITNLVGGLTGSSASGLVSAGSGLFSTGLSGTQEAFGDAKTMQDQRAQGYSDIAKSAVAVAAAPFTGGASLATLASSGGSGSSPSNAFSNFSVPPWLGGGGGVPEVPDSMFGG